MGSDIQKEVGMIKCFPILYYPKNKETINLIRSKDNHIKNKFYIYFKIPTK